MRGSVFIQISRISQHIANLDIAITPSKDVYAEDFGLRTTIDNLCVRSGSVSALAQVFQHSAFTIRNLTADVDFESLLPRLDALAVALTSPRVVNQLQDFCITITSAESIYFPRPQDAVERFVRILVNRYKGVKPSLGWPAVHSHRASVKFRFEWSRKNDENGSGVRPPTNDGREGVALEIEREVTSAVLVLFGPPSKPPPFAGLYFDGGPEHDSETEDVDSSAESDTGSEMQSSDDEV